MILTVVMMAVLFTGCSRDESHYDMGRFNTYIMTPMSFLCGTLFSLENLPGVVKSIISILPLSHAATSLRSIVLTGSFTNITFIGGVPMMQAKLLAVLTEKIKNNTHKDIWISEVQQTKEL